MTPTADSTVHRFHAVLELPDGWAVVPTVWRAGEYLGDREPLPKRYPSFDAAHDVRERADHGQLPA